ncbi:MAG: tetratricopeptide repeat-containing glycosyltransferase family protein [Bryobacteraceae bacterium]|jgi:tetratricopeptide (TPR) repeat protein
MELALRIARMFAERFETRQSLEYVERAARSFPLAPRVWTLWGEVLADAGREDEAIGRYRRAFELDDQNALACSKAAYLLLLQGDLDQARSYYLKLLNLRPADVEVYRGLAGSLAASVSAGDLPDRVERVAGTLCDRDQVPIGVGLAMFDRGRYAEARSHFLQRLAQAPDDGVALWHLARVEDYPGNYRDARSFFEKVLRTSPPPPDLIPFYLEHLIRTENFDAARAFYRRLVRQLPDSDHFESPDWRGEPVEGRTILLRNDSGYGDTIQFSIFNALLKQAGARTIFECQTSLVELLSTCEGADLVVPMHSDHPAADYSIRSQYLPLMMDWNWDSFSGHRPWLRAPQRRVDDFRLQPGPGQPLRVGLTWMGKPLWRNDPNRFRSIPLAELAPVAAIDGVELFSLQFGAGAEQTASAGFVIRPLEAGGFSETAASVETLDLVISIDTVMAHLACALGKPCFILLPFVADWRWLTRPSDYPLYPTARLFRQTQPGAWTDAVLSVAAAVGELAAAKAASADSTLPPLRAAAPLS